MRARMVCRGANYALLLIGPDYYSIYFKRSVHIYERAQLLAEKWKIILCNLLWGQKLGTIFRSHDMNEH